MRTQKQVGSKVTDYYYDSNNNLIAEKTDSATFFFYYDNKNNPIAFSYSGNMFYYVKNLQGDIVKILDEVCHSQKMNYLQLILFVIVAMFMMKIPLFIISKPDTMTQLQVDLSMLMILNLLVHQVLLLVIIFSFIVKIIQ